MTYVQYIQGAGVVAQRFTGFEIKTATSDGDLSHLKTKPAGREKTYALYTSAAHR